MKQPKEQITVEVRYMPKPEVNAGLSRLYDLLLAVRVVGKDAVTMPPEGSDKQPEKAPVKPE